ncbi:MAG: peptidase [Pseudonocardiales bacterium]|nr:MAG: peptidase [Pseudonocardiales bacterium]
MSRVAVVTACAAVVLGGRLPGRSQPGLVVSAPSAAAAVTYAAPVAGRVTVLRAFLAPPGPYAAGHRGVDLGSGPGLAVLSAAAGRVRFAGTVAGRGVVVIEHPDGILTEYEPVTPAVSVGEPVNRGQPIGRVSGTHGACEPGRCLHWGARRDGAYFDPLTLLVALGPVRLLPWPA